MPSFEERSRIASELRRVNRALGSFSGVLIANAERPNSIAQTTLTLRLITDLVEFSSKSFGISVDRFSLLWYMRHLAEQKDFKQIDAITTHMAKEVKSLSAHDRGKFIASMFKPIPGLAESYLA